MNLKDYKYKTEMHAHTTPASACSQIPVEDEIRIYSELGYDSIVICNHFMSDYHGDKDEAVAVMLKDYHDACRHAKKYGINVILGCEIRFTESFNDYLLFGIDEDFFSEAFDYLNRGIAVFSKWFRNNDRVLIQAHPFRNGCNIIDPKYLDGIETFNVHPGHNSRVAVASQYAKEHDMIVSVGTDFHHPTHEGLSALLTKEPVTNSFELVKVLRSRDYLFEVAGSIILPYGI